MSKKIIAPSKQIVSPQGQAMSSRPPMSDQQAIDRVLGGFINFLQQCGIPTPTKAELRMLLYEKCFSDFLRLTREEEAKQMEQLKSNLPRLQRAAAMVDEEDRKAKEAAENQATGEVGGQAVIANIVQKIKTATPKLKQDLREAMEQEAMGKVVIEVDGENSTEGLTETEISIDKQAELARKGIVASIMEKVKTATPELKQSLKEAIKKALEVTKEEETDGKEPETK